MEKRDHTSIDMKDLADSIRRNFNSYPLSPECRNSSSKRCCIYRVPEMRQSFSPSDYTPGTISIGPLHHGKKELGVMEEHKINYVRSFLGRTKVSMEDFLTLIKNGETNLRNCYAETILFESDEFVRIILVDALFLLELYLRGYDESFITDDDCVLGEPGLIIYVRLDLFLMENQLPFFILDQLFNLSKTATNGDYYEGLSLMTISRRVWESILLYVPLERNSFEAHFSEALHHLDLLKLCLQPSHNSHARTKIKRQNIPSARGLHQAGVKIQPESSKNLLDIKFSEGILKIPFFDVYLPTESIFKNILIFEQMHGPTNYFSDYIFLMSSLISTTKDAELLIEKEVIGHRSEELSIIFKNLYKDSVFYQNFEYSDVVGRLQEHCKRPCNHWKAILKQNYFNTPWASVSVIAAFILLLLTIIQTTCSIIAL